MKEWNNKNATLLDEDGTVNQESQKSSREKPKLQITDRRFWVQDEEAIEKAAPYQRRYPAFVEELKARTETAEQKLKERLQQLEQENAAFRERLDKELERRLEQQKRALFSEILEVIDNFERALAASAGAPSPDSLSEGVRLNLDLLFKILRQAGVTPVESLHQPFNPHQEEALGLVPVDDPELDGKVVEVVQKAYRLGDQLIRPAMVRVGKYEGDGSGESDKRQEATE